MLNKKTSKYRWLKILGTVAFVCCYAGLVFAASGSDDGTLGGVAEKITGNFAKVGQMMMGVAYLGGFGFSIAALFKFKQHKDNPTQIPLGTPIALLVIGVVLIFMPGIIKMGGATAGLTVGGGFDGTGATKVSDASSS